MIKYDVSILVPIYNVERFIDRCLHSLFGQTYDNIQFVFIDDCSPDNSVEVINKILEWYPKRRSDVKIIKHEKNKGLAAARNTAIDNAEGEYILHIDSDDFVQEDMVQKMILKAKQEGADIVFSDFYLQWERKRKYVHLDTYNTKEEYLEKMLDASASPVVWNKMFLKKLYIENNIRAIEGINFGEDIGVTPKLVYFSKKIVKLDKAFVHYVQYNNNSYSKKITDKNIEDIVFTLEHLKDFFSQVPNPERYLKALEIGKLQKKLEFLKHIEGDKLSKIIDVFNDSSTEIDSKRFGLFDRIVLNLGKRDGFLLRVITFGYKKVFVFIQYLKGR